MTSSMPHLKEYCTGCVINNKGVRELLMKHDGTLENCPFRVTLYIHKTSPREQLLQNNHNHGSLSKESNKNDKSNNTDPTKVKISHPCPNVNSVYFEYPDYHTDPTENTHEDTHHIDTQE